jgi:photosystem II stability/assembly factor-like uncharacterized protein/Tol biopolymer transport system component
MQKIVLVLLACLVMAACGPAAQATFPVVATVPTAHDTLTPLPTGSATLVASLTPSQASTRSPSRTPVPYIPASTTTPLPALQAGQPLTLTSLRMIDLRTGWATEASGHILRTSDGGSTWRDVTPPEGAYRAANFYALDAAHAWAVAGASMPCGSTPMVSCPTAFAWRTFDGGASWQRGVPFTIESGFRPVAIRFADPTLGRFLYVDHVGMSGSTYMGLVFSSDGGATWTRSGGLNGGLCLTSGLAVSDAQSGWAGTDCRVVTAMDGVPVKDFLAGKAAPGLSRTQDGGRSWEDVHLPPPGVFPGALTSPDLDPVKSLFCGLSRLVPVDAATLLLEWACSLSKYTAEWPADFQYDYLTSDNGQSWHSWLASGNEDFVSPTTGFRLMRLAGEANATIQRTADGGLTWSDIHAVAWPQAQLDFLDRLNGWALVTGNDGAFALVRTTDGGQKWLDLKPVLAPSPLPVLTTPTPTAAPLVSTQAISLKNLSDLAELARRQEDVCKGAWSPDGNLLAIGWSVTLYDARSLQPLTAFDASSCAAVFSPDGSTLETISSRGEVQFWSLPDGVLQNSLDFGSDIRGLAYSPDGTLLATHSTDGSVRLWRVADLAPLTTLKGSANSVESLSFSPDGKLLASGSWDNMVRLWDVATGEKLATLIGHTNNVDALAFSPDGKLLASGSYDGTVRIWQIPHGAPLLTLEVGSPVPSLAFSPDGSLLAAGSQQGTISFWDTVSWQVARQLEGHTSWVLSLGYSPDGTRLLSVSSDGTWRLWGIPAR